MQDIPNRMLGNCSFSSGLCEGDILQGVVVELMMLQNKNKGSQTYNACINSCHYTETKGAAMCRAVGV